MEETNPASIEELYATSADSIDGHNKATSIIGSTLAIVSLIASSALIWFICRSKQRLSTTYHRLVFGLSVGDILFSLSLATFSVAAPKDDDYYAWNVHGNQASCSAQGFVLILGSGIGVFYSCSLSLYYLCLVRYQKPERYIRSKIEPFLHGVPVLCSLVPTIFFLANQNINHGGGGNCNVPVYEPPHCIGFDVGVVREGFTIPCGRGRNWGVLFFYVYILVVLFLVPLIIGISLSMVYRSVRLQEKSIARYGVGALARSAGPSSANHAGDRNSRKSMASSRGSVLSRFTNRQSTKTRTMKNRSNSRIVMHRAFAYGFSFFATWIFFVMGMCCNIAGVPIPTALLYLVNIFNPLQGVYTFTIFMYPKVAAVKFKGGDGITWAQAFAVAFWSKDVKKKAKGQPTDVGKIPNAPAAEEEKIQIEALQEGSFHQNGASSALGNLRHSNIPSPLSSEQIETHPLPNSSSNQSDDDDQGREEWQQNIRQAELYFQDVIEDIDSSNVRRRASVSSGML